MEAQPAEVQQIADMPPPIRRRNPKYKDQYAFYDRNKDKILARMRDDYHKRVEGKPKSTRGRKLKYPRAPPAPTPSPEPTE